MSAKRLGDCLNQEYREIVDETRVAPPFWVAMHKAAREEDIDSGGVYDSRSGRTVYAQTTANGELRTADEIDHDVWRAINIWATVDDKPKGHPGFKEAGVSKELLGIATPVEMDEHCGEIILERKAYPPAIRSDGQKEFLQSLRDRQTAIKLEAEEAGVLARPLGHVWIPHSSLVDWVLDKFAELKKRAVRELLILWSFHQEKSPERLELNQVS